MVNLKANEACSTDFAINMSYLTSTSGIIVSLKSPPKIMHMLNTIFVEHGLIAHNP